MSKKIDVQDEHGMIRHTINNVPTWFQIKSKQELQNIRLQSIVAFEIKSEKNIEPVVEYFKNIFENVYRAKIECTRNSIRFCILPYNGSYRCLTCIYDIHKWTNIVPDNVSIMIIGVHVRYEDLINSSNDEILYAGDTISYPIWDPVFGTNMDRLTSITASICIDNLSYIKLIYSYDICTEFNRDALIFLRTFCEFSCIPFHISPMLYTQITDVIIKSV
jgi:hypothetical protein